ncbi:prolyl oligopeptidase family serine peptidase [Gemmatimonadota bacterium Y43]|uniref:S9 family peptidase n=1 Tax=Gaopeijia maritima TaxID=3119007 RepID=UPI00327DE5EE
MSRHRPAVPILVVPILVVLLAAVAPLRAQTPRPLTLDDYGPWARISGTSISPDGGWLGWVESPNEGDSRLFVRSTVDEREFTAVNGQSITFSDDGRRVAFLTTPPEGDRASGESRGPIVRTLHWIDLESGIEATAQGVRDHAFGAGGRYLAVHRDAADREAEHDGSDLLLHDLEAGTVVSLGNVSAFAFNDSGSRFAWLVDAAERAGNGLYLMETEGGRLRALDTRDAEFDDLAWNEAGDALVALRGTTPEGMTLRENTLVLVSGIGSGSPTVREWTPSGDAGAPSGLVLSELGATRWVTDDLVALGLKDQEPEFEDERADDDKPNVDVWHWNDDRLQSQQMVQAAGDRRFTYTAVYDVTGGHVVPLATPEMRRVDITDDGRWAIGRNDMAYRGDVTVAGGQVDLVRLDPRTGDRAPIASGVRRAMGSSPDGRFHLHVLDERVHLVDLESLETTDLTESTGIDFIDREFDVIAERPAYGLGGWTEGSEEVLLYTRFDVIAVPTDGGAPRNLTGGMGDREQIRFRLERLDPEEEWVDLDDALLSAYGERTKRSGWFALDAGSDPRPLLYGDEMLGGLRRAADGDRVVFTRQTFEQFPDLWVSDLDFASPRRMSDANPQIADFAWGRRVLVDYTDDRGHELQATLALPADYVEGERYPMVVYFYEKMSQRHHQFSQPVYDDRPHMSTYASNGYLVLMPDIVYEPGRPGSSALDDVVSAAQAVIDLGYADPDRIGLQGHSWGGYESSFIVTQTDMFAAVVTGAPLTNLMSMYNINYKSSGSGNGPILEWSQGRLGTTPWDDFDLFVSQSPIHHAQNISTPFLILHGTDDGAVDWNQGLEFYNAARRLEKEVILLSYPGEPHHLAREANQKDFQRRMMEYFDHHLRGVEAPEWIESGVPFLRKGQESRPKVVS